MKTKNPSQKSSLVLLVTLVATLIIAFSCASDSEDQVPAPPPASTACEGSTASLDNDILPILQQNCAVSGCHVSGTGRANFTNKATVIQFASQIRTNTQAGVMPPSSSGKSLTEAEKALISCWVTNGAKDN
jgi:hypothetical protein